MAITNLRTRKARKGKTVVVCLKEHLDYAIDDEKTEEKRYISSYQCNPATAAKEFCVTKQIYAATTGRTQKAENDIISYGILQSFSPGEITPEEANKIGFKLAHEFTHGQHQFVVATHTNREHIHNHIEINSTALDCAHKFVNFWNSSQTLRDISDRLCKEHGLSVIENPKEKGLCYKEWDARKKRESWKARLQNTIDEVLPQCTSFDQFIEKMEQAGYHRKKGKRLAFTTEGRTTRTDRLGSNYTEQVLRDRLEAAPNTKDRTHPRKQSNKKVNFLIDIPARMSTGKGPAYERWAKIHNLKEMAKTLNFLTEKNLTDYPSLEKRLAEVSSKVEDTSANMKRLEHEMAKKAALKTNIINYVKTKNVYAEYQKSRFKDKFRAAHETDILLHEAAKRAFDALKVKKLPTVATLQAEYSALLQEKQSQYLQYKAFKEELKEIRAAKQNIDTLLNITPETNLLDSDKSKEKSSETPSIS